MVTSERKSQIFNNLKTDIENNRCFECGAENPQFASVNNGCFICTVCVQSHITLGPEVSRVKDLNEEWDIEDLKLITAGGNSSLREFFTHYNLIGTPPNFKYLTRASFFYRDMLSVVAQDKEYEHECPSIEQGIQLVSSFYPELPGEMMAREEAKAPQGEEKKSLWGWAKSTFDKTIDASNKAADKITDKINKFSMMTLR